MSRRPRRWFPAALLVALTLHVTNPQPARAQDGDLDALRAYSLDLVNSSRDEHDLPPLERDATLDRSAQAHARDMIERDYFAHVTPDGRDIMDRYRAAGGNPWRLVTENIGRCVGCEAPPTRADVDRQHDGWMESPEHRENILSPGLTRYGFGLATQGNELIAVQNFSGPGTPRGLAAGEDTRALPDDGLAAIAVDLVNEAREAEGVEPLSLDPELIAVADELVSDPAEFSLEEAADLRAAIPRERRGDWSRVLVLAGSCGGCGSQPTVADVRFFVEQWLEQRRAALVNPEMTHLGIVVRADGEGRKVALAVVAGG